MDAKYSPLEHGGLEAVERTEGMEVVPEPQFYPPDRKSTMLNPEPVAAHYQTKQEHGNYYLDSSEKQVFSERISDSTQTPYSETNKPAYFNGEQPQKQRDGRRYCGMRKAIFIAVLVILALLVIIGAVLGGVLGTLLPKKSESSQKALAENATSPLKTLANTGLASAVAADGSGRLLTYYQDPDGRVIENSYLNSQWTLDDHAKVDSSIVTADADAGSPLAAVSYQKDGQTFRQVFYITATGEVMTTFSTTTSDCIATSWSAPEKIIDDLAQAGSPALGACTGEGLDGIHVYYPTTDGYINEVRYHFANDSWSEGGWLEQSDPNSGVACNVYNNPPEYQIVNVYFRNKATKRLQQSYTWFDDTAFNNDDSPRAPLNQSLAAGSSIAVCSDESSTEYVFFQASSGMITKSSLAPGGSAFDTFKPMKGGASGTKLAAAFVSADPSRSGAALAFQPGGEGGGEEYRLAQWSRSDAVLVDEVVS